MFRHIVSALFFVLLSFLMVRPSASMSWEQTRLPFRSAPANQHHFLGEMSLGSPQCHSSRESMLLKLPNILSERLYCGLDHEINHYKEAWSKARDTQRTTSSL